MLLLLPIELVFDLRDLVDAVRRLMLACRWCVHCVKPGGMLRMPGMQEDVHMQSRFPVGLDDVLADTVARKARETKKHASVPALELPERNV